jgi:hypothetical protein
MSIHPKKVGPGQFQLSTAESVVVRERRYGAPGSTSQPELRTCQRKSYNRSLLSQSGNRLEKSWHKFVKSAARVRNLGTISVTRTTSRGDAGMSTCGRYAPKSRAAAAVCGSAPVVCAAARLRKLSTRRVSADWTLRPLSTPRGVFYFSRRDNASAVAGSGNFQLRAHLFRQLPH